MRKWLKVALIIIAAIVVFSVVEALTIRILMESGIRSAMGLKVKLGSIRLPVMRTQIDIRDVKVYNPAGYGDRLMLDAPRIFIDYDLLDILRGRPSFREIKLDLKEFCVIKNREGELNIDSIAGVKNMRQASGAPLRIDVLELKVGRVVYKDYSRGGEPAIKEYDLDLDERYRNVSDLREVVMLVMVSSLGKTNIPQIAGFNLEDIRKTLSEGVVIVKDLIERTGVPEVGKKALGRFKETLGIK